MNQEEKLLWAKINAFEIDDVDSDFTFTDRLARENEWSIEYSLRTIEQYKKFIFLICVADHPLTPSDQVDQVWHLHLIYTRSYWIDLCKNTVNRDIHHGPTRGGTEEKSKFFEGYKETKLFYEKTFRSKPPEDIWPSAEIQFADTQFTRVNRNKYWIFPKLKL